MLAWGVSVTCPFTVQIKTRQNIGEKQSWFPSGQFQLLGQRMSPGECVTDPRWGWFWPNGSWLGSWEGAAAGGDCFHGRENLNLDFCTELFKLTWSWVEFYAAVYVNIPLMILVSRKRMVLSTTREQIKIIFCVSNQKIKWKLPIFIYLTYKNSTIYTVRSHKVFHISVYSSITYWISVLKKESEIWKSLIFMKIGI